ncbi:TRM11 family methyltransferase [Deinococcus multiflagellatus]|uniref:hypothetical protein n=1 Tax=Deinococcus multiflagellatus TaxID=1656887 RepID=UPI001CD01CCB|nr:hypothetical protein [Deinococcus multiflagellatus]MBZ9715790.1 hypothetical protein [Deinococcus multiflagellatus]
MSILSFPERGEGGDARYRGNCSPKVYEWLLKQARPRRLLDPVMGSGTSLDVALRSGIQAAGADLSTSPYHQALKARLERAGAQVHLGVDATRADLAGLFGPADLVVAHPAYGTQLVYSDDPRDMSQLGDDEVFYEALQALLVNMREATSVGGHYALIIGDTRKQGRYHSYQAEAIARLPRRELQCVRIKEQHHVASGRRDYGKLRWGLTLHEYLLVWQRQGQLYALLRDVSRQDAARSANTWKTIVRRALATLGGRSDLETLYTEVSRGAPDRVQANPNFKAKVRQTLQLLPDCVAEARGVWALAA